MKKISVYVCEYCGKKFIEQPNICKEHEEECNKCNSCKHAYYAYGCEFGCTYNSAGECSAEMKFPKYEVKR